MTSISETAETGKCVNVRHNRYSCPNFELIDLPEEGQLFVSVQTGKLQRLKKIPHKPSVFELEIDNSINGVESNCFKDLSGLNILTLQNNVIPVVESDSFGDLKLNVLTLTKNQIKEIIPGAFKNSKFNVLRVIGNDLKEIKRGVLNHLDLKQMELSNNKMTSIEDGAFSELPNLYILHLNNNALTSFNAEKIFEGRAPKLQILNLQHNNLTTLQSHNFVGLQNVFKLVLGYNQITSIEPGTFNLPTLRKLDLSNNKIRKLDTKIISSDGLKSLSDLYLHNNELTYLSTDFLAQFPNLKRVTLAGNPWQCACLDLLLKWIEENLAEGFQEPKPACIGSSEGNATSSEDYPLSEAELADFKKKHTARSEIYDIN